MNESAKRRPDSLKTGFPAAFILLLLYLVFRHSFPAGLSKSMPNVALTLHSNYPAAAVALADLTLADEKERRAFPEKEEGQLPARLELARETLRKSLIKDPLNAPAFSQLGEIAELQGSPRMMQSMMRTSVSLSLREFRAMIPLIRTSLIADKPVNALYYADILMRSSTDAAQAVAPLIVRLLETSARKSLIERLGENPPWRKSVLGAIKSSDLTDPTAPLAALLALKQTEHPPEESELFGYLNYLLARRLFTFAYETWIDFLPKSEVGFMAYVFNGSFERKISGAPFDWQIGKGNETRAAISPRPDRENGHALSVSFGQSRTVLPSINQIIVLRPGNYRFKGSLQGDLTARRGLQWRVTCYGGPVAGQSEMLVGRHPSWQVFEFDIRIPEDKCDAQYLQLIHMARTPSEQFASGGMWFDEISIISTEAYAPLRP